MSGAVVGISQLQLLPSLDSQQKQGGFQQGDCVSPLVKDFSLLKAEEEGRKLCVKPISAACQELQPIQAPELGGGQGQLPPPSSPSSKEGASLPWP